jgi:hypothetical protein
MEHPDARADVEVQRRLGRLWHATRPVEPDNETWATALAGLRVRLPVAAPKTPHRRFPLGWLAGLAAAAAVAAAVWILVSKPAVDQIDVPDIAEEHPLPVASADDVVITSLWDADDELLLVGQPPLRGPLALADQGDVQMMDMNPNPGMDMQFSGEPGTTPMVIPAPSPVKPEVK